jgi:hypothetical protein
MYSAIEVKSQEYVIDMGAIATLQNEMSADNQEVTDEYLIIVRNFGN